MPTPRPRKRLAKFARLEKFEQADIEQLLTKIGGKVYHIGTKRRKGDHQGTMQTEGIPDVFAFLPARPISQAARSYGITQTVGPVPVWIEVKRKGERIRPGTEQEGFRLLCVSSGLRHWTGTLDDIIRELVDGGWVRADSFPHYRQPR